MKDTAIIRLYFARDEAAISESEAKYGKYCRAVADHILHSPPDAEECVSDTWLRAWNTIPPKRPGALKMFFAAITRNLAFDRWRAASSAKRGGGEMTAALDELAECIAAEDTAETVCIAELTAAVNRFLASLPIRERDIFLRRYYFAESTDEIAGRYALSSGTVLTILSRTRKKLREMLIKEGYHDEI